MKVARVRRVAVLLRYLHLGLKVAICFHTITSIAAPTERVLRASRDRGPGAVTNELTEALSLMRVAGIMACCAGRPRDDCPYDPIFFPIPANAWRDGWDFADACVKVSPVAV
jgi:hypothetical protein